MRPTTNLIAQNNGSIRKYVESVRKVQAKMQGVPGYTMNNPHWPGLAKVVEESGELNQILGKIMAVFGKDTYYEGEDLRMEAQKESADLLAALTFFIEENNLDKRFISRRVNEKLAKYASWKESNQ